jgi:hypothetical protein
MPRHAAAVTALRGTVVWGLEVQPDPAPVPGYGALAGRQAAFDARRPSHQRLPP